MDEVGTGRPKSDTITKNMQVVTIFEVCYMSMYYVYLLRSLKDPTKTYIGHTNNLEQRLEKHNSGGSIATEDFRPWKLVAYIALDSAEKALSLEQYLKVGSGHAFAKRRLW